MQALDEMTIIQVGRPRQVNSAVTALTSHVEFEEDIQQIQRAFVASSSEKASLSIWRILDVTDITVTLTLNEG